MVQKDALDYGRYNPSDKITKFTPTAKKNRRIFKSLLTRHGVKYKDTDPTNVLFRKYAILTERLKRQRKG